MILASNGIIAGKGILPSSLLTNIYAVYRAENNTNDSLGIYNGIGQGGLTYTTGKSGSAFLANGINAQILMPDGSFNISNFTYAMWVNVPSIFVPFSVLFSNFSNVNGNFQGIRICLEGTLYRIDIYTGNTTTYLQAQTGLFTVGNYDLIVFTNSANSHKFYKNGSLIYNNTSTYNVAYESSNHPSFLIEDRPSGTQYNYPAPSGVIIDECYVWDRQLTDVEISDFYNSGIGKYYPF